MSSQQSAAAVPDQAAEADHALAAELATDHWSVDALREHRTGIKWGRYEREVLPVWVADMDLPVAPAIRAQMTERVARSDLGYMAKGAGAAGEAFAEHMSRQHHWALDPADVYPLVDVVQGLFAAVMAYTNEGDRIVVQTPIYPPFLHACDQTGRTLVEAPLSRGDTRFEIDLDALDTACAGAKLLMLCNPHNPGGRVMERAELERIAAIAEAHDLVVVSDEIHSDLVFDQREHIPFASLGAAAAARTLTFNACTKAHNVAGLRYALMHFGSPVLRTQYSAMPSQLFGGPGVFGEEVSALAWRECRDWQQAVVRYLQANRDWLADAVATRLPGVSMVLPEATYLAWLDCRGLKLNRSPYDFFLEHAKVGMNNGEDFGAPGHGHVRLNFATPRALLEEVVRRMEQALAEHASG